MFSQANLQGVYTIFILFKATAYAKFIFKLDNNIENGLKTQKVIFFCRMHLQKKNIAVCTMRTIYCCKCTLNYIYILA